MPSADVFLGVISVTSALLLGQVASPALSQQITPFSVAIFYRFIHAMSYWSFFSVIVGTMLTHVVDQSLPSTELETASQPVFLLFGLLFYAIQSIIDILYISHFNVHVLPVDDTMDFPDGGHELPPWRCQCSWRARIPRVRYYIYRRTQYGSKGRVERESSGDAHPDDVAPPTRLLRVASRHCDGRCEFYSRTEPVLSNF